MIIVYFLQLRANLTNCKVNEGIVAVTVILTFINGGNDIKEKLQYHIIDILECRK